MAMPLGLYFSNSAENWEIVHGHELANAEPATAESYKRLRNASMRWFQDEVVIESGHVVGLRLRPQTLNVDAALRRLPYLRILDLHDGSMPILDVPPFAHLQLLSLVGNNLEQIHGLEHSKKLRVVHLARNDLHEIPIDLAALPGLIDLSVSQNLKLHVKKIFHSKSWRRCR